MSDEDEINQKIKQRMEAIFPDLTMARTITSLAVSKKPFGWGPKSNAPYYKEEYALQLKKSVDNMIVSKGVISFPYSKYCTEETRMSRATLYNLVNQSIRYLCERLDDADNTYKKWYEEVKVERDQKRGAVVIYYPQVKPLGIEPDILEPMKSLPQWRKEMDNWLESSITSPFVKENLILTPEEVHQLKVEIAQLDNIMSMITSRSVKLVKVNV